MRRRWRRCEAWASWRSLLVKAASQPDRPRAVNRATVKCGPAGLDACRAATRKWVATKAALFPLTQVLAGLEARRRTAVKKLLLAATALVGLSSSAHASVIPVLDTVTPVGTDYEFRYSATLAGDTGLTAGNVLVIFDFVGYVAGSVSAGIYAADVDAFTELTSLLTPPPGFDDDPTLVNLVFKWKARRSTPRAAPSGRRLRRPAGPLDLRRHGPGRLRRRGHGSTTALALGLPAFNTGPVAVPVPEPSSLALLVMGLALDAQAGDFLTRPRRRYGAGRVATRSRPAQAARQGPRDLDAPGASVMVRAHDTTGRERPVPSGRFHGRAVVAPAVGGRRVPRAASALPLCPVASARSAYALPSEGSERAAYRARRELVCGGAERALGARSIATRRWWARALPEEAGAPVGPAAPGRSTWLLLLAAAALAGCLRAPTIGGGVSWDEGWSLRHVIVGKLEP